MALEDDGRANSFRLRSRISRTTSRINESARAKDIFFQWRRMQSDAVSCIGIITVGRMEKRRRKLNESRQSRDMNLSRKICSSNRIYLNCNTNTYNYFIYFIACYENKLKANVAQDRKANFRLMGYSRKRVEVETYSYKLLRSWSKKTCRSWNTSHFDKGIKSDVIKTDEESTGKPKVS